MPADALTTVLADIDRLLADKRPKVAAKLRAGASRDALAPLAAAVGQPLPAELATWFAWHDGQSGSASLSPLDNRMLMSVADALETIDFQRSPDCDHAPWPRTWIPLLSNGAGDHVVLDTSTGRLLDIWHEDDPFWTADPARWPAGDSLQRYLEQVRTSLQK